MTIDLGALDAVLVRDIADIPDLPDYKSPPEGVYVILIEKIAPAERNEKTLLAITYVVDSIIEQTEADIPEADQVIPGNKFSESFYFDKVDNIDMTLGALKKKFAPLAEAAGSTNLKEILEFAEGKTVQCVITNRVSKNKDTGKLSVFAQVRDIALAA